LVEEFAIGRFFLCPLSPFRFISILHCTVFYRPVQAEIIKIKVFKTPYFVFVYARDELLCDQQRDVVIVFWGTDGFEARVPEFYAVFSVECTLYSPQLLGGRGCMSNSRTLASNIQNTANPKHNDGISVLISQYLISGLCRI
jgi:hypothetical protein